MPSMLHKGVCYPDQAGARSAACADYPLTWASGSSSFSLSCAPGADMTAALMSMCKSTDGAACVIQTQPWPSFSDCDYSGGANLSLDYGLVGMSLLVVIWGGKKLIGLFSTNQNPD